MTSFLSTFVNKVDRKGRVSVPAPFRAALSNETFQGVIAYPSLTETAIDGVGRATLEDLNRRRMDRTLEDGDFERALLGGDTVIDTIMALAHELPFDGEGRIVLPASLAGPAGITDRATFVGRGTRFQIWAPDAFEQHQQAAVAALRQRLSAQGGGT
ncbi:MAG: division/cell wall cluster transcriptional repressor MraZ [Alphaproteobacteria bacterium]